MRRTAPNGGGQSARHHDAVVEPGGDAHRQIEAMKQAYPEAGLGIALEIGAKVNKGEMKW